MSSPIDLVDVSWLSTLPCDMVLLQGEAVVDESVLTGESAPAIKRPADLQVRETHSERDTRRYMATQHRCL